VPRTSVKSRLREYLTDLNVSHVDENEWERICRTFSESSSGYLRRLLRESGKPLAPLVEGVRQDNIEELERTLLALEGEYARARDAGNREREYTCRQTVILAKEHARLAMRPGSAEKRRLKREMIAWMQVWLENPQAFPAWLRLRKRTLDNPVAKADESGE